MRVLLVVLAMLCAIVHAAKAQAPAWRASLEDQSRCAAHAEKLFKELGGNQNTATPGFQSYAGHYSVQYAKCFILIEASAFPESGDTIENVRTIYLYDAVERRSYGEYVWTSSKDKKYSEVKPMMCRTTPMASGEGLCDSEAQFRQFVSKYME